MCNFVSFLVVRTPEGLKYYTGENLNAHCEAERLHKLIGVDYAEVEWDSNNELLIRIDTDESESLQEFYDSAIRKDWSSRRAFVDSEIMKHLENGRVPNACAIEKEGFDPIEFTLEFVNGLVQKSSKFSERKERIKEIRDIYNDLRKIIKDENLSYYNLSKKIDNARSRTHPYGDDTAFWRMYKRVIVSFSNILSMVVYKKDRKDGNEDRLSDMFDMFDWISLRADTIKPGSRKLLASKLKEVMEK